MVPAAADAAEDRAARGSAYTALAVGWLAVGLFTVLGPVTAWFNVFCLVLWTANAAFCWITYVRARRTQR
ncbi:hypothetical protein AB0K15_20380 [Amycolatopsis sp. NPDC049253]|uniref:hypothetical protein n=1 Tax=Amycolatopsis sp. NPDC049253 TaxID=3155274 RepID=UPI00342D9111